MANTHTQRLHPTGGKRRVRWSVDGRRGASVVTREQSSTQMCVKGLCVRSMPSPRRDKDMVP